MTKPYQWLVALIAAAGLWHYYLQHPSVSLAQGGSAVQPLLTATTAESQYTIRPLVSYEGRFRLLHIEKYRLGREAELSPADFVLAWGAMAQPYNYRQVRISQNSRWFYWQADHLPIPQPEMEASMANTHIIPASAAIARQLATLRREDLVWLKGSLVEVSGSDGWKWRSSLSRTDTGAGACEVFLVQEVRLLEHHSALQSLLGHSTRS